MRAISIRATVATSDYMAAVSAVTTPYQHLIDDDYDDEAMTVTCIMTTTF